MIDERVTHIFNEMEDYYDDIVDLWYSWIFSRLHYYISKDIITKLELDKTYDILDIGCGTGFQSILFSLAGCNVVGIDISDKLIRMAQQKNIPERENIELFKPNFEFVDSYNKKISKYFNKFKNTSIGYPKYFVDNATAISQNSNCFDIVNCCGSTLSFIDEHTQTLKEINRCLKMSGQFIIEVEAKRNFDLIWTLLDSTILFGKLGYETSFKEAISLAFGNRKEHVYVEYPFGETKNPIYMNLKLFSKRKLIKELENVGLRVEKTYSIHSVTNLIPSTVLDTEKPNKLTKSIFNVLSKLEQFLGYKLPGCSLVLIGRKVKDIE